MSALGIATHSKICVVHHLYHIPLNSLEKHPCNKTATSIEQPHPLNCSKFFQEVCPYIGSWQDSITRTYTDTLFRWLRHEISSRSCQIRTVLPHPKCGVLPLHYNLVITQIAPLRIERKPLPICLEVCYHYTIVRTLIIPFRLSTVDQSAPPSVTPLIFIPQRYPLISANTVN